MDEAWLLSRANARPQGKVQGKIVKTCNRFVRVDCNQQKVRIALVFLHAPADFCGWKAGSRSCNLIGIFDLDMSRGGMGTKGLRQNEIRNHGEVGDELQRVDHWEQAYGRL